MPLAILHVVNALRSPHVLLGYLNPRNTFRALAAIDAEPPSFTEPTAKRSKICLIVLFSTCWVLLLLNYVQNPQVLLGLLRMGAELRGVAADTYVSAVEQSDYQPLWWLGWWGLCHALFFVAVPVLIIKLLLKRPLREFGAGWGTTHSHWQGYLALLTPIIGFAVLASFSEEFVEFYPFYRNAGRSITEFLVWECIYLIQFASLEFFFRGFMIHALRPSFGSGAIWIMVVPYLMIHFSKPWLEATGSIFFGLYLAILAFRSRSIWGGFFVHAGVALSMDISSLVQQGQFPGQ